MKLLQPRSPRFWSMCFLTHPSSQRRSVEMKSCIMW